MKNSLSKLMPRYARVKGPRGSLDNRANDIPELVHAGRVVEKRITIVQNNDNHNLAWCLRVENSCFRSRTDVSQIQESV